MCEKSGKNLVFPDSESGNINIPLKITQDSAKIANKCAKYTSSEGQMDLLFMKIQTIPLGSLSKIIHSESAKKNKNV